MKRIVLSFCFVLAFALVTACKAGVMRQESIVDSSGRNDMRVASGSTVYSHSFETSKGSTWGLESLFESTDDSDISITVQLENSNVRPTTEGVAHSKWSIPVGSSDIYTTSTANTTQYKAISIGPWKYGRFKVTNHSTTSATTCTLKVNEVQN